MNSCSPFIIALAILCTCFCIAQRGNRSHDRSFTRNISIQAEIPSDGQIVFASDLLSAWRIRGLDSEICIGGCVVAINLIAIHEDDDEHEQTILQTTYHTFDEDDFHGSDAADEGLVIETTYYGLESYVEFLLKLSASIPSHDEPTVHTVRFRTGIYPRMISSVQSEPDIEGGACRLELRPMQRLQSCLDHGILT